jgi:hypothetical protein
MKASLIIFLTLVVLLAGALAQQKQNPKNGPAAAGAKKPSVQSKPTNNKQPPAKNAPKSVPPKAPVKVPGKTVNNVNLRANSAVNKKSLKGPGISEFLTYIQSIVAKLPNTTESSKMITIFNAFGNMAKGVSSGLMSLGTSAASNISQCVMMANQTFQERAMKLYMVIGMTSQCAAKDIVEKIACKFNQNLTMCMSGALMKLNETLSEKASMIAPKFMTYLNNFQSAVLTCKNMTNSTSTQMTTCFTNVMATFSDIVNEVMMMVTSMPTIDLSAVFMPFKMCVGSLMEMSGKGMEMIGKMFEMLAK